MIIDFKQLQEDIDKIKIKEKRKTFLQILDKSYDEVLISKLVAYFLNERNISYCAWNISNTKGSASIFVHGTDDIYDVSDSNLKVWGQYLKAMYRKNAGLK